MKKQRVKLYVLDMKYVRNLSRVDDKVMSVSPQISKEIRPFVGIIVLCNSKQYCIPLSSPKPKHYKMKNDIDFMKIFWREKLIGVLNLNNMIPVNEYVIEPLPIKVLKNDSIAVKHYKNICQNQLSWCQRNQELIERKANNLYCSVCFGKVSNQVKKRCCNFLKLEKVLTKYCQKIGG